MAVREGGRARVGAVRAWRRQARPAPSLLKRLEPVYYVFITLAIGGPFVYGMASEALAEVTTPHAVAVWAASLALVGLLALVRWGAVQGPVVFSLPDVAHLLGAPLPRADLVLRRLLRGLALAAGCAAVLAAIALVGIAGNGRGLDVWRGAAFVVAVTLLGVLGMAGASLVQGSRRWDRTTRWASWPAFVLAVALVVVASSGRAGEHVALWSGPWGWAVEPVAGGGAWPLALVLQAALTTGAVVLALGGRGAASTERHLLRAEARNGAMAALYSLNARYVRRSMSTVTAGPTTGRGRRLPTPRSPRLAIVWRDAQSALGLPQRLLQGAVLAAGGTVVCVVNAVHPAAVAAGALAVFAGASRLMEPLRAETDNPHRVRVLLRAPMGRVLAQHAIVPGVVVLAAAAVAVAGCAIAGALPDHGGAVVVVALLATPAVTLCAALSSRRGGQIPASLMAVTSTDQTGMSGGIIFAWIVAFPVLGVLLESLPVSVVAHSGGAGLPQLVALLVGAAAVLAVALGLERFAP